MLGKSSPQAGLFRPDHLYRTHVGQDSFYVFLSETGLRLFRDEDYAALYRDGGRPSVPPSQLCIALILQSHDGVSDEEAIERTAFDIRWKVALGIELEEKLCAKSTLQAFRSKLILNDRFELLFERSVEECRRTGLIGHRKLEVAIDTTPIFGKGAVKDTFNLVADQIRRVIDEAVMLKGWNRDEVIAEQGLSRYFGKSFKGAAEIDWSDKEEKRLLVGKLVADARLTLAVAKKALDGYSESSEDSRALREAQALLADLLTQDIDEKPEDGGGPQIKAGTSRDRIIATTDPEMRHGRKSGSSTFNGYKGSVAADTESGVILATDVIAGNAHDGTGAAEQIQQAGQRAGVEVERVLGDTAYGGAVLREKLAKVAGDVVCKAPPATNRANRYTVDDFLMDEVAKQVICPAEKRSVKTSHSKGETTYTFSKDDCTACPLRDKCTAASARTVSYTEVTKINQAHRREQRKPAFLETYRRRVAIEHRLARLIQLGIRKARFFGRLKVRFQVSMAAVVANLCLTMV